jgi:hypothetical protein
MRELNAKGQGSRGTAQGQESNANDIDSIDQICTRPVLQSELAETQQRRAVILEALAPFVGQEVRHA